MASKTLIAKIMDRTALQNAVAEDCAVASRHHIWFLFILATFLVSIFCVGQNNYPVNDDWIFAEAIRTFLETSKLEFCAAGPLAYPLIMLGIDVSHFFGFSYQSLHTISTIFTALAAIGLYCILLELNVANSLRLIAVSTFLFNPLVFNLANHFMTEPMAMAGMLWYAWSMLRYFKNKSAAQLTIAALTLSLTVATRQPLVVLVIANVPILLRSASADLKKQIFSWVGLLLAPLAVYTLANELLSTHSFCPQQFMKLKLLLQEKLAIASLEPAQFVQSEWLIAGQSLAYLGLFVIPLMPILVKSVWKIINALISSEDEAHAARTDARIASKLQNALVLISAAFFAVLPLSWGMTAKGTFFPYFQNLISPPYVGVYGLFPSFFWTLGERGWALGLTLVSEITSFILLTFLLSPRHQVKTPDLEPTPYTKFSTWLTWGLAALFLYTIVFLQVLRFDRYLLVLFPYLLVLVFTKLAAEKQNRFTIISCVALLLPLSVYSTAALMDLTQFTQARWQAINSLQRSGVAIRKIDGGPELNLPNNPWLLNLMNQPDDAADYKMRLRGQHELSNYRWWPAPSFDFIISRTPIPGYKIRSYCHYFSPIKMRSERILVLEKIAGEDSSTGAPAR